MNQGYRDSISTSIIQPPTHIHTPKAQGISWKVSGSIFRDRELGCPLQNTRYEKDVIAMKSPKHAVYRRPAH